MLELCEKVRKPNDLPKEKLSKRNLMKSRTTLKSQKPTLSLSSVIFSLTLITCLAVSTLTVSIFSPLTLAGRVALVGTLTLGTSLLLGYVTLYKVILKPFIAVGLLFFSLTTYYALSWATQPSPQGLTSLLQLVLAFGYFSGLVLVLRQGWLKVVIRFMAGFASLFVLLHAGAWVALGTPRIFSSYFAHPNVLGSLTLFLLFFPVVSAVLATRKLTIFFWLLTVGLGGLLIFATTSRSAWLAVAAMAVTYLLWRPLTKSALGYHLFILAVFTAIGIVVVAYANLPDSPQAPQLNAVVMDYTGKNLLSGRDRFWSDLITLIRQRPFFGYGAGALPEDYLDIGFSAHNSYLQVSLQGGLVGLILFLGLLWSIWGLLRLRYDPTVRVAGSFFVAILVHQTFEVSLLQNNLTIGTVQWLVIACGVAAALAKDTRRPRVRR